MKRYDLVVYHKCDHKPDHKQIAKTITNRSPVPVPDNYYPRPSITTLQAPTRARTVGRIT